MSVNLLKEKSETLYALTASLILHAGILLLVLAAISGAASIPSVDQGLPMLRVSWVSLPTESDLAAADRKGSILAESAQIPLNNQRPLPVDSPVHDPKEMAEKDLKPSEAESDQARQPPAAVVFVQAPLPAGNSKTAVSGSVRHQASPGSFAVSLSGWGSAEGGAGGSSIPGRVTLAYPRYGVNSHPRYPEIARMRGYEGIVLLSAEIHADGTVGGLMIKRSSGYTILDRSAFDAVRTWKFEPAREMGKPRTMWVDVPVRFVLREG